jgi:hypothetical protein
MRRNLRGHAGRGVLVAILVIGVLLLLASCGGQASTTTTAALSTTLAPSTTVAPATTASSAASSTTAAPGSSASGTAPAGAEATIKANWEKFFDAKTPQSERVGLLQDGTQHQQELDQQAANPLAQTATATATSVTISSPTTADVIYTINVGGQPVLSNQKGQAIFQDNVWKVSWQSFQALIALENGQATPSS